MIDFAFFVVTPSPFPPTAGGGTGGTQLPEWLKIAVTLFSGGVGAYLIRQIVEGHKLKKSLKVEISGMHGLETCKNAMESRDRKPSNEELGPKEVPSAGSIPTQIYESNVSRLGLIGSDDLENIVEFYSSVLYYKSIMEDIREGKDVPGPDQDDLYESIGDLEEQRQNLFGEGWMND